MTPEDIDLVQSSFVKVMPISAATAKLFYDRLFEIAPYTRAYFRGDIGVQRVKLMTTLSAVVEGLHDLDEILPVAKTLAIRHVAYGVKPKDYQPVGEALVWALAETLGDEFTAELREAWLNAYADLSAAMIAAAYRDAA